MIFGDVIFGVISLLISIWFMVMAQGFKAGSASDGVPGAGFFPTIVCIIMIVVSIALIIQGFRKKDHYFTSVKRFQDISENTRNLILTCVALIAFVLLWKFTLFIPAIVVLILFLNALFHQKVLTNIIYTAVFVTAIYLVFGKIFHVMF